MLFGHIPLPVVLRNASLPWQLTKWDFILILNGRMTCQGVAASLRMYGAKIEALTATFGTSEDRLDYVDRVAPHRAPGRSRGNHNTQADLGRRGICNTYNRVRRIFVVVVQATNNPNNADNKSSI